MELLLCEREAAAPAAHVGDQNLQPGMVNGEHLVAEELLGARKLTLGRGEVAFACQDAAECDRGVRTKPGAIRAEGIDERLRPIGVDACMAVPSKVESGEGERGARERMPGRSVRDIRVLDRLHRHGPGVVDPARQIQRARVAAQRRHQCHVRIRVRASDLNCRRPHSTAYATSVSGDAARTISAVARTYAGACSGQTTSARLASWSRRLRSRSA